MKRLFQLTARALRALVGVVGSFALWTLWLGLVLLLAAQIYVLSIQELAVPRFVLREIETRLAESGFRATFSRTSFDPTGRILAQNVRLSLPDFPEPIVSARSVYVRLNPWMLAVGRFEAREIRIVDGSAAVPAMLSPTGHPAEIVSQLDAVIEPADKSVTLHQLSGRIAGVIVSARGTLVTRRTSGKPLQETIADFVRNRFTTACRQAIEIADRAAQFEQPELHIDLAPSESGAAAMNLTMLARGARFVQPFAASGRELRASTRLLLFGDNPTSWIELSAGELQLPGNVRVRGVRGDVYGRFQGGAFFFEPRELTLTADFVEAAGVSAHALSGQVFPRPLPKLDVTAVARIFDAPLAVRAQTDFQERQAGIVFDGELAPAVLGALSERLRVDVRKYFDFTHLAVERGEVRLGAGWKFETLDARVRVDGVNAYGVKMTDGRAVVHLDPQRFYSPEVFARVGENFARGSYEQDLRSLEYRFLLQGRLRPLEIATWFRPWWTNFFDDLEFPTAPPAASVDVRGVWRDGQQSSVFVFADTAKSIVRGTELDRARTRLFIRPGFFDVLELSTTRGEGRARGRFTFILPPDAPGWESFDLAFESSLDLRTLASIAGPDLAHVFQPFKTSQPPELKINGRFTGPAAPQGRHQDLRVEARTAADFRFHNFPLQNASFVATLKDEELKIDDFEASIASGVLAGHARAWGQGEQRRLGFDLNLEGASLGQVAGTVQDFLTAQKGLPPEPPGKFVREKANVKLDFDASAEGRYNDPLSFRGSGNASLKGPEIAEIALLGALSEVLKFTALRITEGQANFKIEGPKITFPEVKFRGPSAAIDARGTYALEKRELDFHAKIFPFQESENLIKSVVGAVLTPLSNAFEVKLSGSLAKPEWAVTLTPANLLRSLTPGDSTGKSDPTRATASPDPDSKPAAPAVSTPTPPVQGK